jgi:hypothetical protein
MQDEADESASSPTGVQFRLIRNGLHATYIKINAHEAIRSRPRERAKHSSVGVERRFAMAASNPAKLFITALLITPIACFAQSGGSGGGSSGGSSGGTSSGGSATGGVTAAPNAGSPGAGSAAINGVTGPANPAGGFNTGNDPSGAGNAANNNQNRPGTNSVGTANSSGAPRGSTTVGAAGNPAGGATGGRIDGTVTQGPRLPGDDAIKDEDAQNSKVDKKIKSICRGC